MFQHLRMNLAYKKILGKFTKVLGFGKTPTPPCWEKFPNNIVFFMRAYLISLDSIAFIGNFTNPITISSIQATMQYRLRLIESGHQRLLDFAFHFIYLQIFQLCISTERLILSASKYIPDTFFGDKMYKSSLELDRKRVNSNVCESFKYFPQNLLRKNLKKIIISKVQFHHEWWPQSKSPC